MMTQSPARNIVMSCLCVCVFMILWDVCLGKMKMVMQTPERIIVVSGLSLSLCECVFMIFWHAYVGKMMTQSPARNIIVSGLCVLLFAWL